MLEQYIGHINRLCCAADSKNWTDSNHIADGTVRWNRVMRDVTGVNWLQIWWEGSERGVFSVSGEVSKIRFEQLTVMMHIAIASR